MTFHPPEQSKKKCKHSLEYTSKLYFEKLTQFPIMTSYIYTRWMDGKDDQTNRHLKRFLLLFLFFFSTIFSFQKLVCSFWQIARLQEFFINYRIGSHKHLQKLLPFVVLLLLFHHLLLPGWGTWMDGKDDHHQTD